MTQHQVPREMLCFRRVECQLAMFCHHICQSADKTKTIILNFLCVSGTPLDLLTAAVEIRGLQEENRMLRNRVEHLEAELKEQRKPAVTTTSHSTQTEETKSSMTDCVRNSKVKNLFYSYTGLTFIAFTCLLNFLVPNEEKTVSFPRKRKDIQKLLVHDQLLLVLMRLRGGFSVKDLAFRFRLSEQSVSELFSSWIGYMFCQLGQLSWWPHRDTIINHMPDNFKKNFPQCLAIIDCTEIKTETPSSLKVQSQCYSDYKSSTTLKSLVAVDPMGALIFVSALFSGSISDNEICVQSGFYEYLSRKIAQGHLKAGDVIMADKGFTIDKELGELGLGLNIPPFASSAAQMSVSDVAYTNLIAAHRIHVERRIGRIKKLKLVGHKIPIKLFPIINEIWFVCSFLTNFQDNILKKNI